jgi:hypothetical protein
MDEAATKFAKFALKGVRFGLKRIGLDASKKAELNGKQ